MILLLAGWTYHETVATIITHKDGNSLIMKSLINTYENIADRIEKKNPANPIPQALIIQAQANAQLSKFYRWREH